MRYTSVFPACYDGRRPHIHFEASVSNLQKVSLSSDNVFGDDGGGPGGPPPSR
ncbi:hypothetical protein MUY14_26490 [Amycolatopsis sp. FBCC-B4732]|uniref:Intradiol ring-cleavage dioxygenase n=1 Tax=Amycolatopsis orientalis subsp. vinearia TaxID=797057 RepID=A0A023GXJ9_AMYOR|nr:hypothetical protein [Amycolatopsis sp. FBCC-B4732]AFO69384.1 intradiol ring-cleavage dioxygenase [Amycolatopsis orientalis subsp. vinearia]UOX85336.1 hypothetical protein MUY14_26490 [Amycolatopsis sp. FBCC-B4732]